MYQFLKFILFYFLLVLPQNTINLRKLCISLVLLRESYQFVTYSNVSNWN